MQDFRCDFCPQAFDSVQRRAIHQSTHKPLAWRTVPCKSCGAPMVWLFTVGGSRMPVDAGTVLQLDEIFDIDRHKSHFATCPNADKHRRRR